jgi:hypothetical protein
MGGQDYFFGFSHNAPFDLEKVAWRYFEHPIKEEEIGKTQKQYPPEMGDSLAQEKGTTN